jgi:cytochrome P450
MSEPFAFNPIDEATRRDPFPTYQRARREVPVYAHPGLPVTSVFRYDDVQGILRDPRTWSSAGLRRDLMKAEAEHEMPPPMMLQDGAEHARLRSLVNQAFTPRIVARLEPWIRAIAHELLDAALATSKVDLVAALATPLPVRVIAELIGIPTQDGARFVEWSDALAANVGSGFLGASSPEQQQAQVAITRELHRYFEPLVSAVAASRATICSRAGRRRLQGSHLSFPELLQMLMLLLVAGNETTTTLIGNAVLDLLERPELLARGRRDRAFLPAFVESAALLLPDQMDYAPRHRRQAARPPLRAGRRRARVAQRGEPRESLRARRFVVDRRDDRHLAFGFGSHFCLGSNLARLETRVALDVLLERTREIEPDWSGALPLHPSFVFRSYTCVPVRLAAA